MIEQTYLANELQLPVKSVCPDCCGNLNGKNRRIAAPRLSLSATRISKSTTALPFVRWGIWNIHVQKVHVYKVYANEVYAGKMHAHEVHACEMHVYEVHTHEMHAHEMHVPVRYTTMRCTSP